MIAEKRTRSSSARRIGPRRVATFQHSIHASIHFHGRRTVCKHAQCDRLGRVTLIAHVCETRGPACQGSKLQRELAEDLPQYMMPSLFVPVRSLPKSASLKIDRKQLVPLASKFTEDQVAIYSLANTIKRAPSTRTETRLRQLWSQILTRLVREAQLNASTVSLATVLGAAWAVTLANFSNSEDVLFAEALSGRNAPVRGIIEMIAPTITTVPVRLHASSEQGLGDLLNAVNQQTIDMMPFEHAGLLAIQEMTAKKLQLNHLFLI